jgi:hypothetical protein
MSTICRRDITGSITMNFTTTGGIGGEIATGTTNPGIETIPRVIGAVESSTDIPLVIPPVSGVPIIIADPVIGAAPISTGVPATDAVRMLTEVPMFIADLTTAADPTAIGVLVTDVVRIVPEVRMSAADLMIDAAQMTDAGEGMTE